MTTSLPLSNYSRPAASRADHDRRLPPDWYDDRLAVPPLRQWGRLLSGSHRLLGKRCHRGTTPACGRRSRPRERLATLEQAAREADHEVEKAIRSWAMADRYVAAAQQRVDQVRHEHLTKHYIEAGFTPARADTLARIGFSILVGAQQFGTRVDHKRLNSALDEYSAWVNSSVSAEVTTSH